VAARVQLLRVLTPTEPASVADGKYAEWNPLPVWARRAFEFGGAVGSAIFALVIVGVAITVSLVKDWPLLTKSYATFFVLWTAFGYYRGYIAWAHTSWRLDNTLRIRRGRWWRSETIVPRVRVQHLDLSRGPVERKFGLATLTIYTAGSTVSAVTLSGLGDATAVELRDALLPVTTEEDRDGI
jgi:membrane protein YdbS with pleckstrin-like domain